MQITILQQKIVIVHQMITQLRQMRNKIETSLENYSKASTNILMLLENLNMKAARSATAAHRKWLNYNLFYFRERGWSNSDIKSPFPTQNLPLLIIINKYLALVGVNFELGREILCQNLISFPPWNKINYNLATFC